MNSRSVDDVVGIKPKIKEEVGTGSQLQET